FEINDDEVGLGGVGAEPARLRADVLDVEMPVVVLAAELAADGLLDGVAGRQRVEDEARGFRGVELRGRRTGHAHGEIEKERVPFLAGEGGHDGFYFAVTRRGYRAFVAEERPARIVGEHGVDGGRLAGDGHVAPHKTNAVAIVDPRGGVSE